MWNETPNTASLMNSQEKFKVKGTVNIFMNGHIWKVWKDGRTSLICKLKLLCNPINLKVISPILTELCLGQKFHENKKKKNNYSVKTTVELWFFVLYFFSDCKLLLKNEVAHIISEILDCVEQSLRCKETRGNKSENRNIRVIVLAICTIPDG